MIKSKPPVSLLIPIYNVEKQIERCVRSLFEQTFDSIEYIFVDDASPDKSVEILLDVLKDFPHRAEYVSILRHSYNQGLGVARADALNHASGDWIWHIDSDDYIALDAVEKLYNAGKKDNVDAVICNFADVYSDGTVCEKIDHIPEKKIYLQQVISGKSLPYVWKMFVKKRIYTENDIQFEPNLNYSEDYAVTPRLLYNVEKIVSITDVLYFYVHSNENSYCSVWKNDYMRQKSAALKILTDFFENGEPQYLQCLTKHIVHSKCQFYRMYATSRDANKKDLELINNWQNEISFRYLLKHSPLPYKPIIVLAYLRLNLLLKVYALTCKFLYRLIKKL